MSRNGRFLGLRTKEGAVVYPARQFFQNEDGEFFINPAISSALQFLIDHEAEFADLRNLTDEEGVPLINEWTIAGVLLQRDENGQTLIEDLQRNISDPNDTSWARLKDLNGIASTLRKHWNPEGN